MSSFGVVGKRARVVAAGIVPGALVAAGCLSVGAFDPPVAGAAGASGAPLIIGVQAAVNTPLASIPQIFDADRAAAKAINKSGGIHGRPVRVLTCNGGSNPNQEVGCAQRAVSAGAVAIVGSQSIVNEPAVDTYLASANTANLAEYTLDIPDYKGQDSAAYPLGFVVGYLTACTSKALQNQVKSPLKGASVMTGGIISPTASPIITASAKAQGTRAFDPILTGLGTTDFSPAVAQAAALHPNLLNTLVLPPQVPELITSAKASGKSWDYCTIDGYLSSSQLSTLASTAGPKFYFGALYPPPSSAARYPAVAKYISQLRAAGDDLSVDFDPSGYSEGLNAWLGMQVFAQVARSITGPLTNTSFLAKLKQTKVNLGVLPPINFGHPIGSGAYSRVFSDQAYLLTWNPTKKFVQLVGSGPAVKNTFAISDIHS